LRLRRSEIDDAATPSDCETSGGSLEHNRFDLVNALREFYESELIAANISRFVSKLSASSGDKRRQPPATLARQNKGTKFSINHSTGRAAGINYLGDRDGKRDWQHGHQ
jgi:hypothetical protein